MMRVHSLSRRSALKMASIGAVLALATASCGGSEGGKAGDHPDALKNISVVVSPGASLSAYYIANTQGFFKDVGLNIKPTVVTSSSIAIAASIGGKADVGLAGGLAALQAAIDQDAPITVVGTMFSAIPIQLIVRKKVLNPSELDGLTAMVIGPVSTDHVFLKAMLKDLGADPNSIKTITTSGGTTAQVTALQSGAVDMAALSDPYASQAVEAGASSIARVPSDEQAIYAGVITTKKLAAARDNRIAPFLKALSMAYDWARNNPDDAKKVLSEALKIKPGPVLDRTYATYITDMTHPDDLATSDKMLQGTLDLLKLTGINVPSTAAVKSLAVDNYFATEASKKG